MMNLLLGHSVVREKDFVSEWIAALLGAAWQLDLCWADFGAESLLQDPRLLPTAKEDNRSPTGTPDQALPPGSETSHGTVGVRDSGGAGSWVAERGDFPGRSCTVYFPAALGRSLVQGLPLMV